MKNKLTVSIIRISILCILIVLTLKGLTFQALGYLGLDPLSQSNEVYLEKSFHRAMNTFGVLSGIKVGLAIVEGTEVGVGASVQIGDAVQAAYDYVDIAWRTVLASSVILLGTQYLLKTANLIGQGFLSSIFIFMLFIEFITLLFRKTGTLRRILKDITLLMLLVTLSLLIMLPLSVTGGRWLSQKITAPSLQEAESGFEEIQSSLFPEASGDQKGILKTVTGIRDKLTSVIRFLTVKADQMREWMLKMMAGYLFDCLIFPIVLFLLFFWLVRLAGRYFFHIHHEQTFRQDVAKMMTQHGLSKKHLKDNLESPQ